MRIIRSLLALAVLAAAGSAQAQPSLIGQLPAGAGKDEVQAACTRCHVSTQITAQHRTLDQWAATVDKMISLGAKVSDTDYEAIVAYLAANFGPPKTTPPAS